ncbi:MAG TPA: acyl-CoA desaturase, partial [Bryobacteraceae bacterium]|nr:acyl-CoA desaturase [Bryobacteraceae bacterium]
ATNIQLIALMTGGEGLHNNHHEYPSSAKFALKGREFDPAWPVIRLLERMGLATVRPEPIAKAA